MTDLHIGCSGFIELNVTFYRLPRPEAFTRWHEESGADICFALRVSRYITHLKRLLDVEGPLDRFFASAQRLKEKLRAVLWQFPSDF